MLTGMDAERFDAFERSGWSGRAVAYARGFARITAPAIEPLLDAAGVGSGTGTLDAGCGPGPVSAAALARGARVTAVDADPGMLELAARRCPQARTVRAVLPELPFEDNEFDAAVGNFVINHTGHPPAAVRELRRVLRPGGRLALTCWRYPAMRANTVFSEAVEAARVAYPEGVPSVVPFSAFAERDTFAALLTDAGCTEVTVEELRWTHRVDPDRWWADVLAGTCVNAAVITSQDAPTVERIKREYDRIVAAYSLPGGEVELPAAALLAVGS
jgi:SAM-dependent methyltransferase